LRAEIKKYIFFNVGHICTILSLPAMIAQCTLATIFHFELAPCPLEGVKIAFSDFSLFSLVKI
jgi:hypothetical protein